MPTSGLGSPAPPAPSLRTAAVSGIRWGSASAVLVQLLSVASTVVLARLLTPADFGLVAAATIAVDLFALFTRFGFGAVLVNRRTLDDVVASTMFWLAVGVGVVAASAAAATAPLLASLLGQPRAAPYIAAASALILLGLISTVSEALLLRALRFRFVYIADTSTAVVYAAVAVGLAIGTGLGPWSIIIGRLAGAVLGAVMRVIAARWRPRLVFRPSSVRDDLAFGAGFLGTQLLSYTAKNVDYWVVSRTGSAGTLGLYYIAYVLPNVLRQRMTWLMSEILFPVLSRLRDDPVATRKAYTEVLQLLAFLGVPALAGLAILSDVVVVVFFGERWAPAAAPMAIIAVASATEIVTQIAGSVFLAHSRASYALVTNGLRVVVLGACLAVSVSAGGGLVGVALSVLASTLVGLVAAQALLTRVVPVSPGDVARAVLPALTCTGSMVAVVLGLRASIVSDDGLVGLLSLASVGAAAHVGVARLVFRSTLTQVLVQVRSIVRR